MICLFGVEALGLFTAVTVFSYSSFDLRYPPDFSKAGEEIHFESKEMNCHHCTIVGSAWIIR